MTIPGFSDEIVKAKTYKEDGCY